MGGKKFSIFGGVCRWFILWEGVLCSALCVSVGGKLLEKALEEKRGRRRGEGKFNDVSFLIARKVSLMKKGKKRKGPSASFEIEFPSGLVDNDRKGSVLVGREKRKKSINLQ